MSALLSARTKLSIIHNWENAAGSCLQHTDNLIFTGDSFYRQPTESPVCLCLNNIYTFYLKIFYFNIYTQDTKHFLSLFVQLSTSFI